MSAAPFKISEEVICIDDRVLSPKGGIMRPPLKYKGTYKVLDQQHCEKCGRWFIDVGIKLIIESTFSVCYCETIIPGRDIWWCNAQRFVGKDENHAEETNTNEKKNDLVIKTTKVAEELTILSN